MNYTKEELHKMDAVEIYRLILLGNSIKKFPSGFWQQPEAKQNAAKCTRYLFEEILQYDEEMIKENNSATLLEKYKLSGMLRTCFKGSPYEVINNAYPDKYKEWEFKNTPMRRWHGKESGVQAVKWLIEDKLCLSEQELKEQLSQKLFVDNGLRGMLFYCFDNSPYNAINSTYPNKFKEWEFKNTPNKYWNNRENGVNATKWLIEEKLKLTDEQELKEQLSQKLFADNGLGGMLNKCFKDSPYEAINSVYPNKYKEWEFKIVKNKYWNDLSNGKNATRWLIEEKLKLTDDEIKKYLSKKLFIDNGLGGMLQQCFNTSPYEAINSIYPNRYKEWELRQVPNRFWANKENGIRATKWLIEDKLKLNDEELKEQLSSNIFRDNGLMSMLNYCFNSSPYEAINSVYPNKYNKSDFKNYK